MTTKLLEVGANERWWCPACGGVYRKAQYHHSNGRYHSNRCHEPLERKVIIVSREST